MYESDRKHHSETHGGEKKVARPCGFPAVSSTETARIQQLVEESGGDRTNPQLYALIAKRVEYEREDQHLTGACIAADLFRENPVCENHECVDVPPNHAWLMWMLSAVVGEYEAQLIYGDIRERHALRCAQSAFDRLWRSIELEIAKAILVTSFFKCVIYCKFDRLKSISKFVSLQVPIEVIKWVIRTLLNIG